MCHIWLTRQLPFQPSVPQRRRGAAGDWCRTVGGLGKSSCLCPLFPRRQCRESDSLRVSSRCFHDVSTGKVTVFMSLPVVSTTSVQGKWQSSCLCPLFPLRQCRESDSLHVSARCFHYVSTGKVTVFMSLPVVSTTSLQWKWQSLCFCASFPQRHRRESETVTESPIVSTTSSQVKWDCHWVTHSFHNVIAGKTRLSFCDQSLSLLPRDWRWRQQVGPVRAGSRHRNAFIVDGRYWRTKAGLSSHRPTSVSAGQVEVEPVWD